MPEPWAGCSTVSTTHDGSTITPRALALILAVAVTALHRRLPRALATRAIAVTLVFVVSAAIPTMWLTTIAS